MGDPSSQTWIMPAPAQLTPPPRTLPLGVGLSFHYNPPGLGKGPKELSVSLIKVGESLKITDARIHKGIPSDIFQTPGRSLKPSHLDPASKAFNPKLAAAADALAGAMTVLVPELRNTYAPQPKPDVDTGIGWGNGTYNLGISVPDPNATVNVWGSYKKHPAPAVQQAVEALTSFGQLLWKEGYHKF